MLDDDNYLWAVFEKRDYDAYCHPSAWTVITPTGTKADGWRWPSKELLGPEDRPLFDIRNPLERKVI